MKRKIILNLAISLDGYISDEDGGFDWIVGQEDKSLDTKEQIDFFKFVNTCDTVIMGKKGYDDAPEGSLDIYKDKKIYVVTNSKDIPTQDNVEFINGDVVDKILKEREKEGKNIFLYGGAQVADLFIKANVVDEYIIGIIPTILGKGRKLFLDNNPMIKLDLKEYSVIDGITLLRYSKRG
ncbi:MAG: dihydrofolate reductase family protein [Peptostreptococcaceae bacterium]